MAPNGGAAPDDALRRLSFPGAHLALASDRNGKGGVVATARLAAGTPLLVAPLSDCWTKARAMLECWPVTQALREACRRNPHSQLLEADTTWITLHLVHDMRLGLEMPAARKSFLALLPEAFDTFLSWRDEEVEAAKGSTFYNRVIGVKTQVQRDFDTLLMELGPDVATQLGLLSETYFSAREVIRQYGLSFLGADGQPQAVLVPGLGLFESVHCEATDVRLDVSVEGALGVPHVVLYAAKSYEPHEHIRISCAPDLQDEQYVELNLKFPHAHVNDTVVKQLTNELTAATPTPLPGSQLTSGHADAVEILEEGGKHMVRVVFRLTVDHPLPSRRALGLIGFCILSDITTLNMSMESERGIPDVLSEGCCEQRAAAMVQKELEDMLEALRDRQFPGKALPLPSSNCAEEAGSNGRAGKQYNMRVKLAAHFVVVEKKIINTALDNLKSRVSDPADGTHSQVAMRSSMATLTSWPVAAEEFGPETAIGRAMATLCMCARGLNEIVSRCEPGKVSASMIIQLNSDIVALQSCAHSTGLGELSKFPSTERSGDVVVQKHTEVAIGLLRAKRAVLELQGAPFLNGVSACADPASAASVLSRLGSTCFCLHQFSEALRYFQKSLQLSPSTATSRSTEACMLVSCAVSENVLEKPLIACKQGSLLKQRLFAAGYTHANVPVPERLPLSLPEALAASVPKDGADDFVDLLRLFILHQTLAMPRLVKLLGSEVCRFLMQARALSVCRGADYSLLSAQEAHELLETGLTSRMKGFLVFANVALQPLEGELLVASDFYCGATYGTFTPVPYVARDTCALLASAKGSSQASTVRQVLDAGCGNGALGIASMAFNVDKVTFLGSNPRALRFAKFNAYLNDVGQNAAFVTSKCDTSIPDGLRLWEKTFDLVLTSRVFQPNPANVITSKGRMFSKHEHDGVHPLLGLVSAVLPLMRSSPGASLLASCHATTMDTFAQMLEVHITAGEMCAKIFRDKSLPVQESCMKHLSDTTELERLAYAARLQQDGVRDVTPVVLLLVNSGNALPSGDRIEVMAEHKGLWGDASYLEHEVLKVKTSLQKDRELQQMLEGPAEGGIGRMYNMSWDSDVSTTASEHASEETDICAAKPSSSPWEPKSTTQQKLLRESSELQENKNAEGASWDELFCVSAFGWSPPVNTVSTWRVCPVRQPASELPEELPHFAIVELEGIMCPDSVKDAFRDTFGCQVSFNFDSKSKEFVPKRLAAKKPRRRRKDQEAEQEADELLENIDDVGVLLVPFPPGCYSGKPNVALPAQALFLFQVLADKARAGLGPKVVVTLSCNAAGPMIPEKSDTVSPAAAINAMSRTVRLEVPQLTLLNIDSDMFGAEKGNFELAAQVILELGSPDNNMEIAWRGGERWIRALTLSARNPIRGSAAPPFWCWDDGVVLITGGTGGLGVVSAEALVEAGARRIVLTSRSGAIQRTDQGLEERLEKMRQLGAQIILDKCDTSDESQVRACLDRIRHRHEKIAVVIHAAGVLADSLLDTQTQESMEKSFAAKADGAWYLHKNTLTDKLKAFICFSSTSSLVGNVGQVNYSGANGYMDGLCAMRAHQGLPAMALMWPAVANVGMAAAGILAKRDFDTHDQVGVDVVKQVMRRCVCDPQPVEPLVAVAPPCITTPTSPQAAWFVEPLYTDYLDKELLAKMKDRGIFDSA